MITLAFIGLLGGLITGVSPCVLPMLPIIFFAGSTTGSTTNSTADSTPTKTFDPRPLKIIAGIVVSFSLFTLLGAVILSALGLPDDFLRWVGLVTLTLVGLGLIVPAIGHLIEKPFYRLPKANPHSTGGFLLGLGLGTLYVPCAGPVLAAITVAGATGRIGGKTVVLTIAFAIGAALPLLVFASAGSRIAKRVKAYRERARGFRIAGGVVMIGLAVALGFNLTDVIQRSIPAYTGALEKKVAESETAQGALSPLTGDDNTELSRCTPGAAELADCGKAPALRDIERWFNTPNGQPIALDALRGNVVLVDFWAYSCINCQRATPHLLAWDEAYRQHGLRVVGIHSPEFAFEKDAGNVGSAIKKEKITYPVGQDNALGTWTAFRNRYWPAKYLIDANGTVRSIKFGEGDYAQTERHIRDLLRAANPGVRLPDPVDGTVDAPAPGGEGTTPETFLSYSRATNFDGAGSLTTGTSAFGLNPNQPADTFSLGGTWVVGTQSVTAKQNARSRLAYNAAKVYHVLSGTGTVTVSTPGQPDKTIKVDGTPNAYELVDGREQRRGTITLTYSPGINAYTFSFG